MNKTVFVVTIHWAKGSSSPPIGPLPWGEANKLATRIRKRLWANGVKRRPRQVTVSIVRPPDSIWGWEHLR